jgi:hypothetical protein
MAERTGPRRPSGCEEGSDPASFSSRLATRDGSCSNCVSCLPTTWPAAKQRSASPEQDARLSTSASPRGAGNPPFAPAAVLVPGAPHLDDPDVTRQGLIALMPVGRTGIGLVVPSPLTSTWIVSPSDTLTTFRSHAADR